MDYILEMQSHENEKFLYVKVAGEIDIFNSTQFKEALLDMIKDVKLDLKMDCAELNYIDSTGLGVLIAILKKVKTYDGEIYLTNIKPSLAKLFRITNLDKVFIIEGDAHE